jgi:GNAT superfamily N-acetyltransferase
VEPADAEAYAGVVQAIHPDETVDPDVLRARWRDESADPTRQARYLVRSRGSVSGLAFWTLAGEPKHHERQLANVNVRLVPERQSDDDFNSILLLMESEAASAGAAAARAVTREDEPFHRTSLERNGYLVDRISRSWQLDLVLGRERLLEARSVSRQAMRVQAFNICTLTEVAHGDPWSRLYRLAAETIPDIPTTIREPIPTRKAWMQQMQGPDIHDARIWTAWRGSQLIGSSYLSYPAAGDVWTGYTAVAREYRGRGVARAVKLETIGQAIELDVTLVKTNNDVENSAILHINESLGYEPLPGLITHLKSLG